MKTQNERDAKHGTGAPAPRKRFMMANLVFQSPGMGGLYPNLFLENQLKTLLDPTNVPALRELGWDAEYIILSDVETQQNMTRHPNFMALTQHCDVNIYNLEWPPDIDRFGARYSLLVQLCQEALKHALAKKVDALGVWVADLVFAKQAIPRMLSHLDRGHDGVFMVPIRAACDSANVAFTKIPYAPTDIELFELAYRNLHHLWVHSTWSSDFYTRMPYSMLWNSRSGLLAHNFGITPIVFRPRAEMLMTERGIDSDLPQWIENPHWCTDWTDAPVAGLEPLSNGHYPPFNNSSANLKKIADWALHGAQGKSAIHPCQVENLPHPLFYPNRKTFADEALAASAADLMAQLAAMLPEGAVR